MLYCHSLLLTIASFKITNMKKLFITSMMLMLTQFMIAQTIGEVDLKEINNYGLRKLKDAPKKVFISQFRINFQTMYLDTEKKAGGFRGGSDYTRSYKSAVSASVALGLKGLQEKDLIDVTDELYKNLVDQLKAEGFEIITAEQALVSDELKDWVKRTGGTLNQAQYDGYVSVSPTGFDYLVKGVNDDGKEKNSFFNKAPKISQQLGGAVVLAVNLAVPFANEAESGGSKLLGRLGGGAKVVAETNLAIGSDALDYSGTTQFYANGSSIISLNTKQGMANYSVGNWLLKKPITIEGVIEKKKYKAEEQAKVDMWGQDAGFFRVFDVDDRFMKNVQAIPVESAKYKAGVAAAANKYLNAVMDEIRSSLK